MASVNCIIDISGEAKNLDCAFWIGKGKKYPTNPPPDLTAYCDSLYEVSDTWMKKLLPENDMPIDTFFAWKLPSSKSTLIDISAHSCFLPERVETGLVSFFTIILSSSLKVS